jgi:hypothetical protein
MNKKVIAEALQTGSRKSAIAKAEAVGAHRYRNLRLGSSVLMAALAIAKPSNALADGPNLVVNGDFEDPAIQCGLWVAVPEGSGYITGWNVCCDSTNNINGGCNSFPGYTRSVDLLIDSGGAYSHTGIQSIDMAGTMGSAGDSIFQDVPTQPGRTYTLTFFTSSNGWPKENGLTVEWDDAPMAVISTPGQGQWSVNTFTVQASSELSRLRFVDNIGGGQGSLLDSISLVEASDQEPPVVSCPPSITVPLGGVPPAAANVADFTAQGGSIADNQDPNPSVVSSDQVTGSCPALVTRTYTVTDASGNATQCQQLISVQNHFAADGILWFPPVRRFDKPEHRDLGTNEFVFKYGRTIPVKIRPVGCDGTNLCRNTNIVATLEVLALSDCQDASTAQPVAVDDHGDTSVLMERHGGHLKYDLHTKSLPADTHCFLLKATVMDVSTGESLSDTLPIHSR